MGRLSALALFIMVGFGTASCGFINGLLNRDTDTAETPDASENTEIPEEAVAENEAPAADEEAPETVATEEVLPDVPAGRAVPATLLESTDPNERLRAVERDRPDPYQYVPVSLPLPATPPPPAGIPRILEEPTLEEPTLEDPGFLEEPIALLPDELPEIPEPVLLASEIEVSGIVQLNGADYVIVQAPGEPTPRHVRVGDRLSNGLIEVVDINTRPGSEPSVVLEEQGLTIVLPVGSGTRSEADPTT